MYILQLLGVIASSPYANLQFDTKAVQNWEGFWLCLVINTVFQFSYAAISVHQTKFSVVHREVSNNVYSLSAYYVSELIIFVSIVNSDLCILYNTFQGFLFQIIWVAFEIVLYCLLVFWIVGVNWEYMQLLVFLILSLASFSYGKKMY